MSRNGHWRVLVAALIACSAYAAVANAQTITQMGGSSAPPPTTAITVNVPPLMTAVGAASPVGSPAAGPAVFKISVDRSGTVTAATMVRGDLSFNYTAVAAVRQWQFEPSPEPFETLVMVNVLPTGGGVFRLGGSRGIGAAAGSSAGAVGDSPSARELNVVRVGGGVKSPTKLLHAKPVFSSLSQSDRPEGLVIVEAVVGTDGTVAVARALRPVAGLTEAVLEAVGNWVFSQTLISGTPVPVVLTASVNVTRQ